MMIRRGAAGADVKKFQSRLMELNVSGPVDGSFGGGTESAIKTFKHRLGFRRTAASAT